MLEPFELGFVRDALLVCTVAGALCGLVGVYVTVRGMSYLGHGLSHAVYAGAALGAAAAISPFAAAGAWGVGVGLAAGRIGRRRLVGADVAIGVVTTASFALGVAVLGFSDRARQGIEATIFGSALGVDGDDVVLVLVVAALTAVTVVGLYRPLLFTSFDPDVAAASGIRTTRIEGVLMVLLCAVVLTGMKVLGVTLVAAAVVIPPATGRFLTDNFGTLLRLSAALGAAGGFAGMYLSYHLDVSSGATIVLVDAVAFALAYAATARRRIP